MRVALVILNADASRGGAEKYTVDLAQVLRVRGQDVTVIAHCFGALDSAVRRVELRRSGATRLRQYRQFLNALDTHLEQEQYDVVHAMLPVRRCDVYQPHAGLAIESVRAGHLKHAGALKRSISRWATRLNRKRQAFASVERELLSGDRPPYVICLTKGMGEAVAASTAVPPDRVRVVYNGIDLEKFDRTRVGPHAPSPREAAGLSDEDVVALFVAQDFSRKGLAEAIDVIAKVNDPRLRLLVVGRDDPTPYQKQARSLGVEGQVRFEGPASDPFPYYLLADFLLFPSRHDPFGLAVAEAIAMGVPVIITRQTGAHEVIEDGQHGFTVPKASDGEALASAIRHMLNPQERRRMATNCLTMRSSLSYEQHLGRVLKIYEQAARAKLLLPLSGRE